MISSNEEILDLFKRAAHDIVGDSFDAMTYDSKIAEFGIDSLSIAEIVAKIEDKLNLRIDDDVLMELRTVQDLVDAVRDIQKQERTQ